MNQFKERHGRVIFLPTKYKVLSISYWSLVKWLKFMFSKESTKSDETYTAHNQFDIYLVNVKLTVKILYSFVAFLENMNFKLKMTRE